MASYLTVIACFTTLLTWDIAENTNNVVLVAFFQGKRFSNLQEFNVRAAEAEGKGYFFSYKFISWCQLGTSPYLYLKSIKRIVLIKFLCYKMSIKRLGVDLAF